MIHTCKRKQGWINQCGKSSSEATQININLYVTYLRRKRTWSQAKKQPLDCKNTIWFSHYIRLYADISKLLGYFQAYYFLLCFSAIFFRHFYADFRPSDFIYRSVWREHLIGANCDCKNVERQRVIAEKITKTVKENAAVEQLTICQRINVDIWSQMVCVSMLLQHLQKCGSFEILN